MSVKAFKYPIVVLIHVIHKNQYLHIKCYKFNGYMSRSPLRPSSGQLLQIVLLQCAYNMGSHNVYIFYILEDGTCLTCYKLYRSHPVVCQYNYYIYSRHTQQSIFTQLSATSSMATCFGRPCDHHQANFYRSCAFNVLTIWDPIMCTLFIYIYIYINI